MVDEQNSSAVTPNPFIAVSNSTALFVTTSDDVLDLDFKPIDSITLLLSMRKNGQQRLDQFWSSWQNEYLLSLREPLHSQRKRRRTAGSVKTFLRRSICHLFFLVLSQKRTPPATTDNRDNNVQPSITPLPKRNAAAISELRSHNVLMDALDMVTACLPH